MKVRIYKATGEYANSIDAWTVLFKLPKLLVNNPNLCHSMWYGNVLSDGTLQGYWDELPKTAVLGVNYSLGKRIKIEDAPEPIRTFALRKDKIWNEACNTGGWDKWNNDK